jgi:hypothetical protein
MKSAAGDLVFAQDLEEVDVAEFPGAGDDDAGGGHGGYFEAGDKQLSS